MLCLIQSVHRFGCGLSQIYLMWVIMVIEKYTII